ncbi:MAG TPA: hypothetical protein VI653_18785 [Steroidobacteraceae bacterium]
MRSTTFTPLPAIAGLAVLLFAGLANTPRPHAPTADSGLAPLPHDLEIELALSALPAHLRDQATVYVLNPATGFEIARAGTNGFHAIVARTGDDAFRGSWPLTAYRSDILYPIAFDAAGAKAQLRIFLDAAALQAKGTPPAELKNIMQRRLSSGFYKAPARAGIAYMLSPVLRTYSDPDAGEDVMTSNYPHVMYYAPDVSNEDIGGTTPGGMDPFLILNGHHGYIVQALGVTERAAVTKQYQTMLDRLCSIQTLWCLPNTKGEQNP